MDRSLGAQQEPERRPKSSALLRRFPEYRRDLTLADQAGLSLELYEALPEFERGLREARLREQQDTCRRCGLPRSLCSDPEARFYPQREVCYASMEREAANAKWQALHDAKQWHNGTWTSWAEKRSDSHPYHRDHGLTIGVTETDLRPADKFLSLVDCGPPDGLPAAGESEDDEDDPGDAEDESH